MTHRCLQSLGLALVLACSSSSTRKPPPPANGGAGGDSNGGTGGSAPGGSGGAGGRAMGGSGGGGSGGSGGGGAGGSGGSGGAGGSAMDAARDTSSADTGGVTGDGGGGSGPAAALHNQVISVACPANTGAMATSCSIADNVRMFDKMFTIGGDPNVTYRVRLKICAVFEARPYSGCMTSPDSTRICINGMPVTTGFAPTYPTLAVKVTEPARTYFINSGTDFSDDIKKLDYTATFEMKGGTTVNIQSNGGQGMNVYTAYQMNRRHTCPNPPGITTQPYLGQFVHFQVESVDPAQ
jgi:hypothetical protein